MSVEQSKVECRSLSVNTHFGSTFSLRIIRSHNVCPQHTGSTELSYFEEIVGTDTEIEFNLPGNYSSRNSGFGQLIQIFITPGKSIPQFLIDIRTGIIQCQSRYIQYTVFRQSIGCFNQGFGCCQHIALFFTFGQHLVEEIIADRTLQFRQVIFFLPEVSYQDFRKFHYMSLARVEVQLYTISADTFEQCLDVFGIEFFRLHTERQ